MARRKKVVRIATHEEVKELGLKADAMQDLRSSNGYIKIKMTPRGADMFVPNIEAQIEAKRKELEGLRKTHSKLEDIQEEERSRRKGLSKKDKKKEKKKSKKEKKKNKKKNKGLSESSQLLLGAIEEYKNKYHRKEKGEGGKHKYAGVTSKPKAGSKKKEVKELTEEEIAAQKEEKAKKDFEKRFEEPLSLIRETLVDLEGAVKDIDAMIVETKESRSRSKHIMLKDLIGAKTTLFAARINSAKSMADIQRTRIDLELKKQKESGPDGNARNAQIAQMNKFFPQLIASGAMSNLGKKDKDGNDKKDDKGKDKGKGKGSKVPKRKNDDAKEKFSKRMTELIKKGDIELTPHEMAIDIQGKYKVAIMRSFKDPDEWKVIALDNNDKIMKDFKDDHPGLLPKKKDLQLRFDDEKDIARCSRTDQTFQVIPVARLY